MKLQANSVPTHLSSSLRSSFACQQNGAWLCALQALGSGYVSFASSSWVERWALHLRARCCLGDWLVALRMKSWPWSLFALSYR